MSRILLVEDDAGCLEVVRGRLERMGHEVVAVMTVTEALALSGPWDLLVLDRLLPDGRDGLAVTQAWPGVAVLTMSGDDGLEPDILKPYLEPLEALVAARLGRHA